MLDKDSNIENVDFSNAISERYLSYALSTIMSRSLPDVRDGLKPVHRRLLYAMLKLKLDPSSGYKKCARVVGDVIGKYHPHGDTAVYDTLVRLAQSFSLRYPLIDGQGNFGSVDGDNAAAMRYTESKMTEICTLLMQDIDQDTVDFNPTYDSSDIEPVLMPSMFPNLLANGSEGIAVGMATSIPPHNLHELCDALIYLIDNQKTASCSDIMQFIKGPDFPTGGVITDSPSSTEHTYSTGKGSFRVRAKWKKENLTHGLYQLVITEIPYQVQKSKLIEQIAILLKDKKIPLISNIRDESAEDIRIIIEPKARTCSSDVIMESLFKLTSLESRVHLNMNVLSSKGAPKVMNILEILQEFIAHRREIILRRSNYQVGKIDDKLEILEALKVAYLNIDEVIRIIREEDNPKQELIVKFKINDTQAEAILNIKLRSLRKLEEAQINAEYDELKKKRIEFCNILENPKQLWRVVKNEFKYLQKRFGKDTNNGMRKTLFEESSSSAEIIDISAFIEKEPITIICSKMGWIRSVKGHKLDLSGVKYKEGDTQAHVVECYSTDSILVCTTNGKFFTILAHNIAKGKGHGESIKLMVDIGSNDIVSITSYKPDEKILLASTSGKGFITNSSDLLASTKTGKKIMQVSSGNKCLVCLTVMGDMIAVIGSNRKLLIFAIDEIPYMKRGQGVILQKYRDAKLSDIKVFDSGEGLSWNLGSKTRLEKDIKSWRSKRGSIGKIPPVGFPKNNRFK